MKKTILAVLLTAVSATTLASSYYVVVPVPNRISKSEAVQVALNPAALLGAVVGVAYPAFEFNSILQVTGDADFSPGGVGWSVAGGALPAGLALSRDGRLTGVPTGAGLNPVQVQTVYKGKSAKQDYVIPFTAGLTQYGGYRAWSDGTLAATCNGYRAGKAGYAYAGAVGDGVYRIDVDGAGPLAPVDVVCDMTTDGGGWTVFQRRVSGALDFYRTYAEYANGFGNTVEYWMGNDRLAALTAAGAHELRVDLARTNGETAYAKYASFKVNPASDGYRLSVGAFLGGPAGDSLSAQNGFKFSTWDVDQDTWSSNCAVEFHGAWWYYDCHRSNLNGAYLNGKHTTFADGVNWFAWTDYYESLARTEMKVR